MWFWVFLQRSELHFALMENKKFDRSPSFPSGVRGTVGSVAVPHEVCESGWVCERDGAACVRLWARATSPSEGRCRARAGHVSG